MKKVVMSFNGSEKTLLIGYQEGSSRLFNMTEKNVLVKWYAQDLDLPPSGIVTRILKRSSGKVLKGLPVKEKDVFFIVDEEVFASLYRDDFIPLRQGEIKLTI